MRADLLEIHQACGFMLWDHVEHPCWACNCHRDQLFEFPLSVASCPWVDKGPVEYAEMMRSAVKMVPITSKAQFKRLLRCCRRDPDLWGLGTWCNFNELGLPGAATDAHELGEVGGQIGPRRPVQLHFFDVHSHAGIDFAAPILGVAGFTVSRLDIMRALDLGCTQRLVATVFWALTEANFARSAARTMINRRVCNLIHLRRRMNACYLANAALFARGSQSRIFRISLNMLGDVHQPRLRAK
ncbi:unnamed protein product, partial [Prorocentrum cordatum]